MSFTKTFSISTKISLKQNQKNRKMEFKIVYCVSKNVLKYLQNDKNKTYFTESWKITKTKKKHRRIDIFERILRFSTTFYPI